VPIRTQRGGHRLHEVRCWPSDTRMLRGSVQMRRCAREGIPGEKTLPIVRYRPNVKYAISVMQLDAVLQRASRTEDFAVAKRASSAFNENTVKPSGRLSFRIMAFTDYALIRSVGTITMACDRSQAAEFPPR
jgi:hypothetical protein